MTAVYDVSALPSPSAGGNEPAPVPGSVVGGRPAGASVLIGRLAPFVAWMATQDIDESTRRAHREWSEAFLLWTYQDDGPTLDQRQRYERTLRRCGTTAVTAARAGLDRLAEHQAIVALTWPDDR